MFAELARNIAINDKYATKTRATVLNQLVYSLDGKADTASVISTFKKIDA